MVLTDRMNHLGTDEEDAYFEMRARALKNRHGIGEEVEEAAANVQQLNLDQLPIPSLVKERAPRPQVFTVETPTPSAVNREAAMKQQRPYQPTGGKPVQAVPGAEPVPEDPRAAARGGGSPTEPHVRAPPRTAAPGPQKSDGSRGGTSSSSSRPSTARMARASGAPNSMADDIDKALDILEYAAILDMNIVYDAHLLWLAEEFWLAPLPDGWEEWYTEEGSIYYHFKPDGTTQWNHPLESYYRALLFMKRSGEAELERSHAEDPPTEEEVADMCEYLGVDPAKEPQLVEVARQAVGAPLPPGWHEHPDTGEFMHDSGTVSEAHPLDVYFLHQVTVGRAETTRRQGGGGRKEATPEQLEAVRALLEAPAGDPFAAMGVSRGSSAPEVRRRYRTLALLVHPDKCPDERATEAFKRLTAAFKAAVAARK